MHLSMRVPGLTMLQAATTGLPEVRIAVLDGPVDLGHPCFDGAHLTRVDTLVQEGAGPGGMSRHGTHVASIVLGQPGSAVTGVAPGCHGFVVPVFRDYREGQLSQLDLARAVEQAVLAGAHVINISGGERASAKDADPLLRRALELCEDRHVLVVAAAGNDGCDCVHVPAAVPTVLAVGALGTDGRPLPSSNFGEPYRRNGVLALGEGVLGAVPGGGTAELTGTSFATPVVAGVAALLLSEQLRVSGHLDPLAVRSALLRSATPCIPGEGADCDRYLAGVLDVQQAYASVLKEGTTTVSDLNPPPDQHASEASREGVTTAQPGWSPGVAGSVGFIAPPGTAPAAGAWPGPGVPPAADLPTGVPPTFPVYGPYAMPGLALPMAGVLPQQSPAPGTPYLTGPVPGAWALDPSATTPGGAAPSATAVYPVAQPVPVAVPPASVVPVPPVSDGGGCGGACGGGSGCGCSGSRSYGRPDYVYALGTVGFDFGTETRRDTFRQLMPDVVRRGDGEGGVDVFVEANPYDVFQLSDYLDDNPHESTKVIWTLNLDLTPIYAIEAEPYYPEYVYELLRQALRNEALPKDEDDFVSRVSIPGVLTHRTVQLFSGQEVPVVCAQRRGMYTWNETQLLNRVVDALRASQRDDGPPFDEPHVRRMIRNFLDKVYFECRNLGRNPADRALNFAVTNAYQFGAGIADGIITGRMNVAGAEDEIFTLDTIEVVKSPYCRIDSDCWDVRIKWFSPENDRRAKSVYQFTIDVNDVLPASLAPEHTYLTT